MVARAAAGLGTGCRCWAGGPHRRCSRGVSPSGLPGSNGLLGVGDGMPLEVEEPVATCGVVLGVYGGGASCSSSADGAVCSYASWKDAADGADRGAGDRFFILRDVWGV